MFSKMNLATRLGLGFGLTMCFAIMLAAAGIGSLASVTAQFKQVSNDSLPKTQIANQNIQAAYDYARAFAYIITSAGRTDIDAASIERARAALVDTVKLVNDNTVILTKMLTSDEEKSLLAKVVASRAAYGQSRNGVLALSKEGRNEDAVKSMFTETNSLQTTYIASIKDLIDHENGLMKGGFGAAESTFAEARMTLILMVVACAVLGTAVSVAISRSLIRSLGGEPNEAVQVATRIATGDLSVAITTRAGDSGSLMFGLKTMRDSLATLVVQVRDRTEQIATASSEIATGSLDLSSRTELQASALQQTAASMETLSGTVGRNAGHAQRANDLAVDATRVASKGGEAVGEVIATMSAIHDSSRKIADITNVIDGIAFQTNILALNAAVEAARAGEQGRGFAVVASEVRVLAQRSAAAAKDIKSLIAASAERADHGTALVQEAGGRMTDIVAAIARVGEVIAQISLATADQNDGVAQVGQAVRQMDQSTQQNAALVEQSSAAAACLHEQAQQLVQAVATFRT